jgi:adenosylhomocysteinase
MSLESLFSLNRNYPESPIPFLGRMNQDYSSRKPLQGVRILHNLVNSYETLLKLEPLIRAGADLTVTAFDLFQLPYQEEIDSILRASGIRFIKDYSRISGEFDIVLDCAARSLQMKNIRVTQGIVELTQSGTEIFKSQRELNCPVVSVDDSRLKNFECIYGTGEAFIRAMQEQTGQSVRGHRFLVFGHGKIGMGVTKYLEQNGATVAVAEVDPKKLQALVSKTIPSYDLCQPEEIQRLKSEIHDYFAVVTCTGVPSVLEKIISPNDIPAHIQLANMGAENEFGRSFPKERLLFSGSALNFSLRNPTLMKYLDPIFYAHNLCAELLIQGEFKEPRYHAFPTALDESIIQEWQTHFNEDVSDI